MSFTQRDFSVQLESLYSNHLYKKLCVKKVDNIFFQIYEMIKEAQGFTLKS